MKALITLVAVAGLAVAAWNVTSRSPAFRESPVTRVVRVVLTVVLGVAALVFLIGVVAVMVREFANNLS